ncbi:MAG: hypothetical protein ABFE07_13650 [Armatimonadia bacterium]
MPQHSRDPQRSFTMKLRFLDGHEEVFEYTPEPPAGRDAVEDLKVQLSRAMKEGMLRMIVDGAVVTVFTASLAYIETTPAPSPSATFPWAFHRLSSG